MLVVIVYLNAATRNLKCLDCFGKASMKFLYIKENKKAMVLAISN